MTSVFTFKESLCLIWKTERPRLNSPRISPVFTFLDREWYMKLKYDTNTYPTYDVALFKKEPTGEIPALITSIYYEHNGEALFHHRKTYMASNKIVWRVTEHDFKELIRDFRRNCDFSLICTFEARNGTLFDMPQKEHKSVQAYFDPSLTLKCFLEKQESPRISSSTVLDIPFSLENLSKDFSNLFDKKFLSDIKLQVGDFSIEAHRALLAARSDVFAAMFQCEMTETRTGVVDIKDVEIPVLKVFVDYLYCGKIPEEAASEYMISKLFAVSEKYSVNSLKKLCTNFMLRNVNEENYLTFLMLAHTYNGDELKNGIACFAVKDDTLFRNEDWLNFAAENASIAVFVYNKYYGSKNILKAEIR